MMRQGPQINVSWSPQPCMPGSMLQLENGECDSSGGPAAKAAMAETTRAVPEDEVRQQAQRQELTQSTRLQLPALEMPAGFHPSPPSAKRSRRSGNAAGGAGSPLAMAFAAMRNGNQPTGVDLCGRERRSSERHHEHCCSDPRSERGGADLRESFSLACVGSAPSNV